MINPISPTLVNLSTRYEPKAITIPAIIVDSRKGILLPVEINAAHVECCRSKNIIIQYKIVIPNEGNTAFDFIISNKTGTHKMRNKDPAKNKVI